MLDLAKAHRQPEVRTARARQVRGPVRNRADRPINQKCAGKPITPKEKPAAVNIVDLMEALRRSVGGAAQAKAAKGAKKPKKAVAGQKEMLVSIEGKKTAREAAKKKPSARAAPRVCLAMTTACRCGVPAFARPYNQVCGNRGCCRSFTIHGGTDFPRGDRLSHGGSCRVGDHARLRHGEFGSFGASAAAANACHAAAASNVAARYCGGWTSLEIQFAPRRAI
ncbi:hypothetical protein ES707_00382 [subsurface metagenome]